MISPPALLSGLGLVALVVLVVLVLWGLRTAIHRGLAPKCASERGSPGDLGLAYWEARIPTANNRHLFAWLVPATQAGQAGQAGQTPGVVLLHGWSGNAETLLPLARPLHLAGFTVLLFDARCHGRSDEDSFASLPRFAEDLEHALDWLRQQPGVDGERLALVGHSVGAGAALLVASRRDDISAVASIAAFSHPARMMRRLLASKHVPYLPFGWMLLGYVQHVIGHRFDDIAPVNTIRKLRCPTLLVHGAEDPTVPVDEARAIHAAGAANLVRLLIIPGSHDDYGDIDQEAEPLVDFLRESVNRSGRGLGGVEGP